MAGAEKDDTHKKSEKDESGASSANDNFLDSRLLWALGLFLGLIFLGGFYYLFRERSVPPPATLPTAEVSKPAEDFFTAFREAIQETGNGKSDYGAAQAMAVSEGTTMPSTMAATLPTETSKAVQFSKVEENYARAVERFHHAKELLQNVQLGQTEQDLEVCKKNLTQAIDRYVDAAETLHQISKTLSQGETSKELLASAPDAKAKYDTADQIFSKLIMEGCSGDFFKFMKPKNNMDKSLAYTAYKNFFGGNFEPQRGVVELLLNYKPPPETEPPRP